MKTNWFRFIACFILASRLAVASGSFEVMKKVDPAFNEIHYGIKDATCQIEWIIDDPSHPGEYPGFGIRERLKTKLSAEKQIPYRRALLQRIKEDTNDFEGLKVFTWGRLRGGEGYEEYFKRFLQVVGKSRHWDRKRARVIGYPRGISRLVEDLLNQEEVFPEIRETFLTQGLALRAGDVEEVIIGTVSKDGTIGFKKSKEDKFPVDFLFSFTVTKK